MTIKRTYLCLSSQLFVELSNILYFSRSIVALFPHHIISLRNNTINKIILLFLFCAAVVVIRTNWSKYTVIKLHEMNAIYRSPSGKILKIESWKFWITCLSRNDEPVNINFVLCFSHGFLTDNRFDKIIVN